MKQNGSALMHGEVIERPAQVWVKAMRNRWRARLLLKDRSEAIRLAEVTPVERREGDVCAS
jgi:hypothetical protein